MALTKDEIISKIKEMTLYEKDYDIIKKILDTKNANFITAVIEEVVKGNLYWSDFDRVLPDEYSSFLNQNLEKQKILQKDLQQVIQFRSQSGDFHTNTVALVEGDDGYSEEYIKFRDDVLYTLIKPSKDDTDLNRSVKTKLFNYINNGKILLSMSDTEKEKYEISESTITSTETGDVYYYINPNDILLSANKLLIPVDRKGQIITDADKAFMLKNDCNEEEMRSIKALYMFLKYNSFLNGGE